MTITSRRVSSTPLKHKLGLIALAGVAVLSNACAASSSDGGNTGGSPGTSASNAVGRVAHDAKEAFTNKPASVPVLSAKDIAAACATDVACSMSGEKTTKSDRMNGVALCVENVTWSAERAIPMSGFAHDNERAEYFVGCVNQHANSCSSVLGCRTDRTSAVYCEEDGCRGAAGAAVTCHGSVATLDDGSSRDCARAFAECDPSSPTGCTDRQFTACPADESRADHCEGNIRLGCDRNGQVSYHDCSRMGGTCGAKADGQHGCIYTEGAADVGCANGTRLPSCDGATLRVCVNGRLVSVSAPALCAR